MGGGALGARPGSEATRLAGTGGAAEVVFEFRGHRVAASFSSACLRMGRSGRGGASLELFLGAYLSSGAWVARLLRLVRELL